MTARDFAKLKRTEQARAALRSLKQTEYLQREINLRSLPQLSTDEVIRRLQAIKASDQVDRINGLAPSMRGIAMRAQVNLSYLYMILNGQRIPTQKVVRKLSAALQGVNIAELN